ncbi:aldehyde dehydrogenase (NAD+) [Marmoricola sp. URHA0025 HA25]
MFIDGKAIVATDGADMFDVTCPSRPGTVLARVAIGTAADVDRAVQAAHRALRGWRSLHFKDRQAALLRIADAIETHAEELAVLTAQDTGNALRPQARPEVAVLASLFRYFAGVAGEFKGSVLPAGDDQLQYTRLEPLGVVAAILPWNSPLMIAGMKIPAAMAAGNTLVVKPAEDAPLSVLRLAQIINHYVPPGVFNVVTGPGSTVGAALVGHRDVHKVSFTGSTEVGQQVARVAGARLIHFSLELGGKSPSIVYPSAVDTPERLQETVAGILLAMRFTRQGQSCTAGSRLFVHRDVYETVLEELVAEASRLVVGDPLEEATDMGSIISRRQYDQISSYVDEARNQRSLTIALDGLASDRCDPSLLRMGPTIVSMVDNGSRLAQEEIFGPVLAVIPFSTTDEVVTLANASRYGLAAYVWTNDLDQALATAHRLETGWVQINQGGGQMVGQSYGGYKESGTGREFSLEGAIAAFSQTKQINVRLGPACTTG